MTQRSLRLFYRKGRGEVAIPIAIGIAEGLAGKKEDLTSRKEDL